ncbi:MAG: hypothetical protein GY785_03260 [Gammaproteobacteria bacterium]|nr:hypothetical protein [Gammaproteobacteria bacterium]
MGIEALIGSAIALIYPVAKKAAGDITEGFLADITDDAYGKAVKFVKWLKEKWSSNPKGTRALEDVESDPDDEISRETLKARLTQAAETDPDFRTELEQKVEESGPAVRVFIAIKEMEDVTGLKAGTIQAGAADVRITGDKAKNVTGAVIDVLGGPPPDENDQ